MVNWRNSCLVYWYPEYIIKTHCCTALRLWNLVLRSENGGNTESYIWQSFDHPSDTLIAGMKLGWDLRVGLDRYLTSWKSADDPSPGDISYRFDLDGLPQGVIRKGCLDGYIPKSSQDWNTMVWNGGCVRKFPSNCSDGQGFLAFKGMIVPDLLEFSLNTSMTLRM
ncbi:S-locus-specific glycoprotein S6-like [Camellia sinensis]|uniref:S-locus-specific glycoprotein S6-like n=1 Tax=Camellia sinensis TaxID=4442 RepID=UPI0010364217|nr:S-locus-specific glycoprotein S6-like [Camellia sinensis]